jgi:phage terminase large subunit-like protein
VSFWREPIQGFPRTYDPWRDAGDCRFDEETAERVCNYWESTYSLKDGKFEGMPFKLQKWQRQILGHLFGWKRPDGTRRYRTLFLYIPKKNGKTQFGAGLGLTLLTADGEQGAEIYSCASDSEQAKIIYDAANQMLEHSKKLKSMIKNYKGWKVLEYGKRNSRWKVLSSRADSKHGPNVHGLLIDELHTQKDNELVETLEAGTISRAQPLVIKMTTAGFTGDTPCNQELEYGRGVRDGKIADPYYMPVIFDGQEADREDPGRWKEPDFWPLVNPSFGITVREDYFIREVNKCKVNPIHAEAVKRLHLNIQTDVVTSWLDLASWKDCEGEIKRDGVCFGALDLANTTDINSFTMFWPETNSIETRFWVPLDTANKRAEYILWKENGHIKVNPGRTSDYSIIRNDIKSLVQQYKIRAVAFDPWNATHIATELSDEDGVNMVEFRQGYVSMNAPAKEFERLILNKDITHGGNPCLTWMAGNVAVKCDPSGNIRPVKPGRNSTKKIDGIVTCVMAVGLANADQTEERPDTPAIVCL